MPAPHFHNRTRLPGTALDQNKETPAVGSSRRPCFRIVRQRPFGSANLYQARYCMFLTLV